jgi:transposase InsO family protein
MASSSSSNNSIDKLDSTNYRTWKFKMQMLLRKEKVWDVVNGTEVKPEAPETSTSKSSNSAADPVEAWNEKDEKALTTICLALSDSELVHVETSTTSAEAWKRLADVHETDALPRKMLLWRQLYSSKFQEGRETMQEYLSKVVTLKNQLTAVGETVSENSVAMQILHSLPESYDNLVVALETRDDIPTIEQLRTRLLQEEARRNENASNRSEGTALYIKQKGKWQGKSGSQQGSSERTNANVKCFHCGKLGHKKAECRKRIAEEKADTKNDDTRKNTQSGLLATAFLVGSDRNKWFIDSAASAHYCCRREWFEDYVPVSGDKIRVANDQFMSIRGKGTIRVKLEAHGKQCETTFGDVSYVPELCGNLLSVGRMIDRGYGVYFEDDACVIKNKTSGDLIGFAPREGEGNLFPLKAEVQAPGNTARLSQAVKANIGLWHRRLGHLGADGVMQLVTKNLANDIDVSKDDKLALCKGCVHGKQHRTPFPTEGATRAKDILEIVHTDVCGPMDMMSLGGSKYFVTFIDDKTHKMFIYFLKTKDEVLRTFQEFKTMAEKQTGKVIKLLRSDNGGEYVSRAFDNYLKSQGIRHHTTVPYTPEQNGVAERANRTILERVRSMSHHQGLSKEYWAEAASTAVYLINRSPTKALVDMTPEEAWTGTKPSLSHIRTFGCKAYAHVPKQKRTKLDQKATECIFVGYPEGTKGYKLFNPTTKTFLTSRDVIFDEENLQQSQVDDEAQQSQVVEFPVPASVDDDVSTDTLDDDTPDDITSDDDHVEGEPTQDQDDAEADDVEEPEEPDEFVPRRSTRERRQPTRHSDYVFLTTGNIEGEPTTYTEAMNAPDASKWEQAARDEYSSLMKNKTWRLVDLPQGRKVIGCKWVFKVKRNALGEVDRYKARLVAKGYSQSQGIDYNETFAPVAKFNSIRTLIALAAQYDLELHQMDVKTAFLNGNLEEDIYMEQPEGFAKKGQVRKVCKLQKSLYGLKQAGRAWYQKIDSTLTTEMGFDRTHSDSCVYVLQKDGILIIMAIYVDDLIILANDLPALEKLKTDLAERFEMKDLGEAQFCLGIQIVRDRARKTISINQSVYIEGILKKFGMAECKPIGTPLDANTKITSSMSPESDQELEKMKGTPYQQAIGSLMYAMLGTRPDIAYAVGALSRYNSNPGQGHWQAVKRIFRYLKGTTGQSLQYKADNKQLVGYCDADWGGDHDDRKSTTGYVFVLAGGAVSWASKKQPTVALSTTEAEYMATTQATKEAIWLQRLLGEVGFRTCAQSPMTIFSDNQSSVALTKNSVYHARTKHIDIQHHFVRERVENQEIAVMFCRTEDMVADVLTKGLAREKHVVFSGTMGLRSIG